MQRVKQHTEKEAVKRVRDDLSKLDFLQDFEVVQLGNLCPADSEEAKALVPSLQLDELPSVKRDAPVDSEALTNTLQALEECKHFA